MYGWVVLNIPLILLNCIWRKSCGIYWLMKQIVFLSNFSSITLLGDTQVNENQYILWRQSLLIWVAFHCKWKEKLFQANLEGNAISIKSGLFENGVKTTRCNGSMVLMNHTIIQNDFPNEIKKSEVIPSCKRNYPIKKENCWLSLGETHKSIFLRKTWNWSPI